MFFNRDASKNQTGSYWSGIEHPQRRSQLQSAQTGGKTFTAQITGSSWNQGESCSGSCYFFWLHQKLIVGRQRTQRQLARSGPTFIGRSIPKGVEAMREIDYRKKQHHLYHFEQLYQCSAYWGGQQVSRVGFSVVFGRLHFGTITGVWLSLLAA